MAYSSSSSPEISVAPSIDTQGQFSYKLASHDEVLEDLSSRFILNLPDEELASLERICFQVEQAHWFYEDFIREENPKFPSLPLKKFSAMLFHACPLLHQWSHDHEQAFNTFMQYKTRVPVCGAIMLNDAWEKCILVKGWKSSSGWGFPKGKINEHEAPHDCAAREVLEETGYNLAGQINPHDVIEMSIKEQKISLYIVAGVPEDFHFQTRTRKEISKIEWFKLTDLPTWKRDKAAPGKFYLISPFIGALKAFINERRPRALRKTPVKARSSAAAPSHIRQKGVQTSISPQSPGINHDRSTQETSSQSSSADNGGPHTPSPLYSEQVAHHANGHAIKTHQEDDLSKTLTTAMDPNLARLLNSLSMSAALPIDDKASAKPNLLEALSLGSAPKTSATPVPISAPSDSPALLPQQEQADWSSQVPKPLSERPTGVTHATPSPSLDSTLKEQRPLPSARRAPARQLPAALSLSPRPNGVSTPSGFRQGSTPPLSAALSSASVTLTSASCSRNSSRRNSNTADISPYLSRPPELPTSGKRLKQLALLETVADESARFTPQMNAKELLPQVGEPGDDAQGFRVSPNRYPSYPPGPSASVPPQPYSMNVLYSSNHGQMQSMPYEQLPRSYPPPSDYDDAFTVRPRTTQSVHQAPFHGHAFPGRPTSMHQNQLLSLLAGPGPQRQNIHGPSAPGSQLVDPFPRSVMGSQPPPNSLPSFGPSQHGMPPLPRGPPSSQAMPHNIYPPQPQNMLISAPSQPSLFNLPPQPNSPTLLSILNGGRSAIPPNMTPEVFNGAEHN